MEKIEAKEGREDKNEEENVEERDKKKTQQW